jgi:GT2 family glycosyltransferase
MNLLLKRGVIEEAGGWNEALPSQYDTDFGYRISQLGYKIAYEPSAKCYHFNRPNLKAYWRQQLQYGKNTLRLYLKHAQLAKGDEITDVGMNVQPALWLSAVVLALLGAVPVLRLLWLVCAAIVVAILVYYVISAARICAKFRDWSAMRLVVLYFVRSWAWLCGAAITAARFVGGKQQ